uniref:Uncharacterized protein n=1 Tax=Anguilla anguilla TaxID=7936 RepID=A0A0E9SEP8_ANGAN
MKQAKGLKSQKVGPYIYTLTNIIWVEIKILIKKKKLFIIHE